MATSTPPLPSVRDVLAMGFGRLLCLCDDLDLHGDFKSRFQCLEAVLHHYHREGRIEHEEPVFATTVKTLFESFNSKRQTLRELVNSFLQVITKEENKDILEKLLPAESIFSEDCKLHHCEGLPSILVLGSTSSGKSSLVNALLGEEILPVHHNAATAVLSEIKYSDDDTKFAIAHFQRKEDEKLDLSTDDGRRRLTEYVFQRRSAGSQEEDAGKFICSSVEIFWPQSFLKHMILVDSPGTTDDTQYSDITKRYQTELASGFIYVVNSTLAAEEAVKVGKLLEAVTNASKTLPSPHSALFVLNKWDLLCTLCHNKKDRDKFIAKFCKQLESAWPGFREDQLITMNSLLASKARQYGVNTQDINNLCDKMKSLLPSSMDEMLKRSVEEVKKRVDQIERKLENTICQFKLPLEERKQLKTKDTEKIENFERALEECKKQSNTEIEKYARELHLYLQESRDKILSSVQLGVTKFHHSKLETDEDVLKKTLEGAVMASIPDYPGFSGLVQWADSPDVKRTLRGILDHFGGIKADFNCTVDTSDVTADVEEELYFAKIARGILIGIPLVVLAIAFAPVTATVLPIWLAHRSIQKSRIRSLLEQQYDEFLHDQRETKYAKLKEGIERHAAVFSQAFYYVYKIIPEKVEGLKKELDDRLLHDSQNETRYKDLLNSCQSVKGALSKFIIDLDIHEYREDDIIWPKGHLQRVGFGLFGTVYKVQLKRKRTQVHAALKVLHSTVDDETARLFVNERDNYRKFKHKNLVELYGTVIFPHFEYIKRAAFLFEWCDGGTLRQEFQENYKAPDAVTSATTRARAVASQVADGLHNLHIRGVIHRDIKPENILLTGANRSVKIAGMTMSKQTDQAHEVVGTLRYIAPEVIQQKPYGTAADIYSLGVVLIEIWYGELPRQLDKSDPINTPLGNQLDSLTWSQTAEGESSRKIWMTTAKRCCNSVAPHKRPKAADIVKAMKDWNEKI